MLLPSGGSSILSSPPSSSLAAFAPAVLPTIQMSTSSSPCRTPFVAILTAQEKNSAFGSDQLSLLSNVIDADWVTSVVCCPESFAAADDAKTQPLYCIQRQKTQATRFFKRSERRPPCGCCCCSQARKKKKDSFRRRRWCSYERFRWEESPSCSSSLTITTDGSCDDDDHDDDDD